MPPKQLYVYACIQMPPVHYFKENDAYKTTTLCRHLHPNATGPLLQGKRQLLYICPSKSYQRISKLSLNTTTSQHPAHGSNYPKIF